LTAAGLTGQGWAQEPPIEFQIPAGDAAKTLLQFNAQSPVKVLFVVAEVADKKTQAVQGVLQPDQALNQMLAGSGLRVLFSDYGGPVVKPEEQFPDYAPPAAASSAPPPISDLIDALAPRSDEKGTMRVAEVVVTGSMIHGVLDITSPLMVVTQKEMKETAYATVQDVLQSLPLNAGSAQNESYGGTGNYGHGTAINLRGLGSNATLVLINGHRLPAAGFNGDFVDVSTIPWSLVERLEVLPDGSSALYGSDAIAGVVNIIMRDHLDGAESVAHLGTARDGADEVLVAQLFGSRWKSGRWLLGYQYSKRSSLAAADRNYSANTDKRPLGGADHSSIDSNPGNIIDPQTFAPAFAIPRGQDGRSLTSADLLPSKTNLQNWFATQDLLPNRQMHNVFLTGSQQLGERVELFGEGRYNQRHVDYQGVSVARLLFVPASNPFAAHAFPGMPLVIVAYSFQDDLGPPISSIETQNYGGTLGMKFHFGATWQATLSASYGEEDSRLTASNQINDQALTAALSDPNPVTAFNPFGDGSHTSSATLAAVREFQKDQMASGIDTASLVADGPLLKLPAGVAKLALGVERRQENLHRDIIDRSGLPLSQHLGRQIGAVFAELAVPLIGRPDNPWAIPRLELSLAGRYVSTPVTPSFRA
jgi:outer membrane receptor protein involved in Fe transport